MAEPHLTNRQRAAMRTREKLLDAARGIIARKGLTGTSISEITQACGVSTGTFYTYFKRKEDVALALSRGAFRDITERALAHDGPLSERLTMFMTDFAAHIENDGIKLCQEWVRNTVDPDLVEDEDDRNKLATDLASATRILEDGKARDELADDSPIDELALTLTQVLYGQMLCWDMSGGEHGFTERTRDFCQRFLPSLLEPYLVK